MASVSLLVTTPDTGNTPNTSGSYTPTSGRLQFVIVSARTTSDVAPTLTNSAGLTFTLVTDATSGFPTTPTNLIYLFVADALTTVTSSQSVTFDVPADASNGTIISVFEISGMTKVGLTAIRQAATDPDLFTDAPVVVFAGSCLTDNPTVFGMMINANPAGMTEPSGWTELVDNGHTTPDHGQEVAARNSGFTGTTITGGSAPGSGAAAMAVEFDASASSGGVANLLTGRLFAGLKKGLLG